MKVENLAKATELVEQLKALREQRKILIDPYTPRVTHLMHLRVGDHTATMEKPRMLIIVNAEINYVLDELKTLGVEGAEK